MHTTKKWCQFTNVCCIWNSLLCVWLVLILDLALMVHALKMIFFAICLDDKHLPSVPTRENLYSFMVLITCLATILSAHSWTDGFLKRYAAWNVIYSIFCSIISTLYHAKGQYEFFHRICQAFPLLNKLIVRNSEPQQHKRQHEISSNALFVTYSHLISLTLSARMKIILNNSSLIRTYIYLV